MTREDAIQVMSCIYDVCLEAGEPGIADRIVESQLMRCWPEIDWLALRERAMTG